MKGKTMQKVLDYIMNEHFITWAIIGGLGAFAAQILILGEVSFWQFWLSNVAGAVVLGSLVRAFRK
jgi:hypothetical protein